MRGITWRADGVKERKECVLVASLLEKWEVELRSGHGDCGRSPTPAFGRVGQRGPWLQNARCAKRLGKAELPLTNPAHTGILVPPLSHRQRGARDCGPRLLRAALLTLIRRLSSAGGADSESAIRCVPLHFIAPASISRWSADRTSCITFRGNSAARARRRQRGEIRIAKDAHPCSSHTMHRPTMDGPTVGRAPAPSTTKIWFRSSPFGQ